MNYSLWLGTIPGIGRKKIKKLREYLGSSKNIYHVSEKDIDRLTFLTEKDKEALKSSRTEQCLEEKERFLKEHSISFVTQEMEEYPKRLSPLEDAPYLIYYKGRLPREDMPSIAMIGARNSTPYGEAAAREFSWYFSKHGIQIISGMARGIDGASQMSAIKAGGQSFGVLGSGIEVCYPAENITLYQKLKEQGGILSEYAPMTKPSPGYFPLRNRIISGLSDVVLVVEAKERSGSLITVEYALEQGKEVFAIPGRINDVTSKGCNHLIFEGAGMADTPERILEAMGWKNAKKGEEKQNRTKVRLEKNEMMVYSCLGLVPTGLEKIIGETKLPPSEILQILVQLQMQGIIRELSKNQYIIEGGYEIR